MRSQVCLGLGSNLGDRIANIDHAIELIAQLGENGVASSLYETTPQGFSDQPKFINAACMLWTRLDPYQLMHELGNIEQAIGRGRVFVNAPRTIDIDVLIYDNLVIKTPVLEIPHPRMSEREFVLRPLAEIAPELVHPVTNQTIHSMLQDLPSSEGMTHKVLL